MSEAELILAKLKIVSETEERGMYLCDKEHSKILLDYITNLQEELDRCIKANVILDNENTELQQRIDKVIEYIEETHYYSEVINEEYLLKSELLEILDKGE